MGISTCLCGYSVKFQAILYAPFIVVIILFKLHLFDNIRLKSYIDFYFTAKIGCLWIVVFILFNPFIIHPKGLVAFYTVLENMGKVKMPLLITAIFYPLFILTIARARTAIS